jgi:hypothetical protein
MIPMTIDIFRMSKKRKKRQRKKREKKKKKKKKRKGLRKISHKSPISIETNIFG